MNTLIEIVRDENEDAILAAQRAAEREGTRLDGNLRWYGLSGPAYREIGTKDGRTIRVREPDSVTVHR